MARSLIAFLLLLLSGAGAWAQGATTPVGLWKSIDEQTGRASALIRITESGGELSGAIEKILHHKEANPVCVHCTDGLKGKPLTGLNILSGMKRKGQQYEGGQILDPKSGKTYRCTLELFEEGQKLKVRGYIGMSLFGRTQIWQREE